MIDETTNVLLDVPLWRKSIRQPFKSLSNKLLFMSPVSLLIGSCSGLFLEQWSNHIEILMVMSLIFRIYWIIDYSAGSLYP